MSLLHDHFEKVCALQQQDILITPGLHIDVGGTLAKIEGIDQSIVEFAQWNHAKKYLGPNYLFSANWKDAEEMLAERGFDSVTIGVEPYTFKDQPRQVRSKQRLYSDAYSLWDENNKVLKEALPKDQQAAYRPCPSYCLQLVLDDEPPLYEDTMGVRLALTWWDPYDKEVRAFLDQKQYLDFTP